MADPKMAAADNFLKIDGIDGESQDDKHKNEIEILSHGFKISNKPSVESGGGGGTGVSVHGDYSFTKHMDKSSPKLVEACATGEHIKKAVLTLRKAGKDQQEYGKITFSDVIISHYYNSNDGSHRLPEDWFSFNYGKIEFEYKEQKPDGTLGGATKGGWDVKARKTP